MDRLSYNEVTLKNIEIAYKIQKQTWGNEDAYNDFLNHINANKPEFKNFIVYAGNTVVGITGVYVEEKLDKDSIWLDWFCVLPEHRKKGYGKQIIEFTISYAKSLNKFKYFRLDTTFWEGRPAIAFYNKVMQFCEDYTAEKPSNNKYIFKIYTTNLTNSTKFVPWNNKFLGVFVPNKFDNYIVN